MLIAKTLLITTLTVIPAALGWAVLGWLLGGSDVSFRSIAAEAVLQLGYFLPAAPVFVLCVLLPFSLLVGRSAPQRLVFYLAVAVAAPVAVVTVLFWRQLVYSVPVDWAYYYSTPVFYALPVSTVFYYVYVRRII